MPSCRVCDQKIEPFMTFGQMPIANGFLSKDKFKDEYFFEMEVGFCEKCSAFQLINQPEPERMFHENYAFFSSLSNHMQEHFKVFANFVIDTYLKGQSDPFVVELGSNDGIMLKHFKRNGFRHLGIEPSKNVADIAHAQGIDTISEFFSLDLAKKIVEKNGNADVIMCANVMCHLPDINDIAAGIAELLKADGLLIFEDPYLGDVISKTSYDQIYDEHVFVFSAASVSSIFGKYGLELIDVLPQKTHGGSMRYVLSPKGSHKVSANVATLMEQERNQGLHLPETYDRFKENCEKSKADLYELLHKLNRDGKRVIGYGATSKSTTVLNYCKIPPEFIEFISDTTPIKQGKFSPGVHIPIKSYEDFKSNYPDYALLFAWNHAEEIFEKEKQFEANGGKWMLFVPKVEVIN
jgi:methylation protein EvaC